MYVMSITAQFFKKEVNKYLRETSKRIPEQKDVTTDWNFLGHHIVQ